LIEENLLTLKNSKLILVGAGPGDPELITIKALKAIQEADYILYDGLVNLKILDLAGRDLNDEKLIFVGKKAGESYKQTQINDLILKLLLEGGTVLRLKGGDPLIFARASEEIEVALNNDFCYEIIPGITSALGAASIHNIPITLRNKSDSVTLVTGHEVNDQKIKLWSDILNSNATLVIYMGIGNIVKISQDLKALLNEEIPAIIIANASLNNEKIIYTNLSNLSQQIISNCISSPALVYLGKSITLNKDLKSHAYDFFRSSTNINPYMPKKVSSLHGQVDA
jgi:uroporphyrin-III C-methyltransferase